MSPELSQGSAPFLVMGTLPWKCDCPRVLLRAVRRMLNTLKLPSAGHICFVPTLHPPESSWHWAEFTAHLPYHACERERLLPAFQGPWHLLVTTGKYQDLGKTLSMWVFPSTLSYSTLKVRWKFLSFPLACFLLPVSGNWGVTGPFVTEGTGPLHLCFLGSFVALAWRVFSLFEKLSMLTTPGNRTMSSFACYTNFTSTLQYLEIFVTSGNIMTASCGKNNPVPPLAMLGWIWVMQMTAMQRLETSFCSLLPQA